MASKVRKGSSMFRKLLAEFFGTFVLVLGGVGAVVLAAGVAGVGVGWLGVAIAFGLSVLVMVYAVGHISGGHFNPAVSLGLWSAGRFEAKHIVPYVLAQVVGGVVAAGLIYVLVSNQDVAAALVPAADRLAGASNGYGAHSPQLYNLTAAIIGETVMTFVFLLVIIGATDRRAPAGFAGIAIGLALTVAHIVMIPITNCSVNPARSLATAVFAGSTQGGWALQQLWVFLVFPIVGAMLAGLVHRLLME
jgi:aquaporin Z